MTLSIDTNAVPPILPARVRIWHEKRGHILFDPMKVTLWLSSEQEENPVLGIKLQKEIKKKRPLNACVLSCLLKHQEEIPEEWQSLRPCFWGTGYENLSHQKIIPCMLHNGTFWELKTIPINDMFNKLYPAVLEV